MRRLLPILCLAACSSDAKQEVVCAPRAFDATAVHLRGYRSKARDASGHFAWYDADKALTVVVPRIDVSHVRLVGPSGEPVPFVAEAEDDELRLRIASAPPNSVDLQLDGDSLRAFRLRPVPTEPDDAMHRFFADVDASKKDWRSHGVARAGEWLALADRPESALAEGEAARIVANAAYVHYNSGDFERGVELLDRAELLAYRADDSLRLGYLLYHRAQLAHEAGAFVSAIARYRDALRTATDLQEPMLEEAAAFRLAALLTDLGRHGEALELLGRRRHKMSEQDWETNAITVRLGAMDAGLLPLDLEAIRVAYATTAERLAADGDPGSVANMRMREAAVLLRQGHVAKARARLDAILADVTGIRVGLANLVYARALILEGRFDDAEARIETVERRDHDIERCESKRMRGLLAQARGRLERAVERYQSAIDCFEAIDRQFASFGAQAQFAFAQRGPQEDLARALVAVGRRVDAFLVADRERAAILERHVTAQDINDHLTAWVAYQTARAAFDKAKDDGCAVHMPGPSHRACRQRLEAAKQTSERALADLMSALPDRKGRARDRAWLARLQEVLGDRRALLLVVGHGEDALHLLVDDEGVFAEEAADPIAAWSERLRGVEHLFVVPDWHPASYDPFGTERSFSVSLLPHADVLLHDVSKHDGPRIVVADPDGTLPRSAEEGVEVQKAIGGRLEKSANRAALLGAYRSASVLHYVGHATGREGDPWSVELRLAGGESVSLFDLLSGDRRPELVVLNGCATGPPSLAGGGGLPAALVHLGVKNVVATTRVQEDGEISGFVHAFYAKGALEDPAVAFQEAATSCGDCAEIVRLWGR
ncbi:MAG: CHAT domain-containing protein [Deltaproteobacteria bacterium]